MRRELKRSIHKDDFIGFSHIPRYTSWLNQASHHKRKDDCIRLKSKIRRLCIPGIQFYEHCVLNTPVADSYVWLDPRFVSKRYNDIRYLICLRTLQYGFEEECDSLASKNTYDQLTKEEEEIEKIRFIKCGEYHTISIASPNHDKFDGRTTFENIDYLKNQYIKNPPDEIKMKVGFSITHLSSHSIVAIGTVNERFLDIPTTNRVIEEFLSLEDEFLPVLQSSPVPSRNYYMKNRNEDRDYQFEKYENVSTDSLILDPDWYRISIEEYGSNSMKDWYRSLENN